MSCVLLPFRCIVDAVSLSRSKVRAYRYRRRWGTSDSWDSRTVREVLDTWTSESSSSSSSPTSELADLPSDRPSPRTPMDR